MRSALLFATRRGNGKQRLNYMTLRNNTSHLIDEYQSAIRAMREGRFDLSIPVDPNADIGKLGIELIKLSGELKRNSIETSKLQQIIHDVSAGLSVEDVLGHLYDSFRTIIPYNRIGCALLCDEDSVLTAQWAKSDAPKVMLKQGFHALLEGSSLQQILATGQPRILNDLEAYLAEHPRSESTKLLLAEGMRSSLTCPLVAQGRILGFLFFSSREKNTYQDIHQEIFLRIAEQLSILIENRHLYPQLLADEETQYKAMARGSLDGFWVNDAQGRLLDVNDAYCHMIGYSREELLNMRVADVEAAETSAEIAEHIKQIKNTGADRFETRHRRKDGKIIDVEISVNFTSLCGGQAYCFLRDITERKRTEEENALKALLLDSTNDSIFLIDLNGNFIYVNDTAFKSRGYSREEFMRMNLRDMDPPEYAHLVGKRIHDLLQHGHAVFESAHIHKDGHLIPIEVSARIIELDGKKRILSVIHDITERRLAQEHFFNANHDTLTGLPNRRLLMDRLKLALVQAKRSRLPMALLFLDIDYFKDVNDRLGHDVGDALLKIVADRIVGCMREEDTVSRLGGDEFVVVLTNMTSTDDVRSVTGKIMGAIALPVVIGDHTLRVTSSIGISIYPVDSQDKQTLMKHADTAMYNAKRAGRNCFRFYGDENAG